MAREIILDTETTGLDVRTGHRLIELACIELEDFVPTGKSFHRYIHPERDIESEAQAVHGISIDFAAIYLAQKGQLPPGMPATGSA